MQNKKSLQIVILSGKGGTGKTTIASAFSKLLKNKLTVDCDVDASNLSLVLNPEILHEFDFSGGYKATIDPDKCTQCGICESLCRFDAIKNYTIDSLSCEGCGFCYRVCPENAVLFNKPVSGRYFECRLPDHSKLFYARLLPGEGNSGKLVTEIKKTGIQSLQSGCEYIIIDGPPGIGCPVNASIAGCDIVVIVTEPTLSGIHDLKRLAELLKVFSVKSTILINKYDLNLSLTKELIGYANKESIPVIGQLPYSEEFIEAVKRNKTIVDINPSITDEIKKIWENIESRLTYNTN